jgi:zinc transport system substrate-binding protein
MKHWLKFVSIGLVLLGLGFVIYKQITPSVNNSNSKLQVTTSFYPLYFFTGEIAGEKADIENITPAGVEPHGYEPTALQVAKIMDSDLLIINGAKLEPWADRITSELKNTTTVVVAAEGLTNEDPHVWLSPQLAKKEVEKISAALVKADPANQDYYLQNTNALLAKLDKLDTDYRSGLASCTKKEIVTSHSAFAHLARAYGLEQVAISGMSPDSEPSLKQLAEVAEYARTHNLKYIFFESLVSPKLSQTIANEIGAQTLVLDPIEGINDEGLKKGENYLTVMRSNLANLKTALECK